MSLVRTFSRTSKVVRRRIRQHPVVTWLIIGLVVAIGLATTMLLMHEHEEETLHFRLRAGIPSSGEGFGLALYQSLGTRLRPGHEVRLVPNGTIFDAIDQEIRAAKSSVHVDVFIWQKGKASDRLIAALEQRASTVECRVLVDDVGSPHFREDIEPRLRAARCETRLFRPLPGEGDEMARNHRKLVVVDGRVAFTGGFGIRDEWLGDGVTAEGWRDANVRFTGPAVADAQQAIAENWQEAGGALFPAHAFPELAPDPAFPAMATLVTSTVSPVLSRAERLVQLLVRAAKKRLWIANAYFVPPDPLLDTFREKARAGIDVRLLMPGKKSDSKISMGSQHLAYGSLVESGVRVFEYVPSMMHAKTIVVDDEIAVVGSINLEPLSFEKLEEDALVVQDRAFADELARSFEQDLEHARTIAK